MRDRLENLNIPTISDLPFGNSSLDVEVILDANYGILNISQELIWL